MTIFTKFVELLFMAGLMKDWIIQLAADKAAFSIKDRLSGANFKGG